MRYKWTEELDNKYYACLEKKTKRLLFIAYWTGNGFGMSCDFMGQIENGMRLGMENHEDRGKVVLNVILKDVLDWRIRRHDIDGRK